MSRFTLKENYWYASLAFGDASALKCESPSPIRVRIVTPLKSGKGLFHIECFHPQNSTGAAQCIYQMQTIHRGKEGMLTRMSGDETARFVYLSDLTEAWMNYHFPQFEFVAGLHQSLENAFVNNPDSLSNLLRAGSEAFSRKAARHWSTDRFWTDAKDQLNELRRVGKFTLDLNAIQERIFAGDSAAYKLMEAMTSVWQREGWDGYKGAPRVLLLLLARLAEQCSNAETNDPDSDRS